MKIFIKFLLILLLSISAGNLFAQDVNVFGFFQGMAHFSTNKSSIYDESLGKKVESETSEGNFVLQQANLLINSNLGDGFSSFVNLEITNNYSSENKWGSFNLQEAYLNYSSGRRFKVKAGLFIPKFNNLYEIYNRTPLLPYVIRPMLYETSLWGLIEVEDFLPSRALVQIYGTLRTGKVKLDYAVYLGSSESSYRANNENITGRQVSGWEYSNYKSIGGRFAVRYSTLKFGISSTYDRDNKNEIDVGFGSEKIRSLGDVPRIRLGADFDYSISGLTITGEVISVLYSLTDENKDSLKLWSQPILPGVGNSYKIGEDLDKLFYFITLQYDFLDKYFIYSMYSNHRNNEKNLLSSNYGGMKQISVGGGYKPIDSVIIKLQYINSFNETDLSDFNSKMVVSGISVSF